MTATFATAPPANPPADPPGSLPRARLPWLAAAIALLLTTAWTIKYWPLVSAVWLPDNDDMARIAQVRDWLAGQPFNDLMQHRSGPPGGASMHWSRIADIGIAGPILLLAPLFGHHAAEVAAVLLYPGVLFFAYLLLVARIAQRLGGAAAGVPALILAAVAFPTISLFLPGRIDHHALQIVLTLALLDTVVAPAGWRRGAIGGLATALSLAVGLEAAPEVLAGVAVIGLAWLFGGAAEDRRLLGFGGMLGGITLLLLVFARPDLWPERWCDGFTPASTRATLVLAAGLGLLGAGGRRLTGWQVRLAAGAAIAALAGALAWQGSAVCIAGPYGGLDPFLQRVWMGNVNEANSLWRQDVSGNAVAYGGLVAVGAMLSLLLLRHDRRWAGFALFMVLGAIAATLQIRVTYIMAGVATIPVAALLAATDSVAKRLLLWVLGTGVGWSLLASQLDAMMPRPIALAGKPLDPCLSPQGVGVVAAQPTGTVMSPLPLTSYVLATSRHRVIASLYHRNNAGNLAMYRFFLSPLDRARAQAAAQGITLVALCRDDLHEPHVEAYRPGSLVERLQSGAPAPAWLRPIPTDSPILLYRVR